MGHDKRYSRELQMAIGSKLRIGLMIALSLATNPAWPDASSAAPHAESMGWRLGVQAYSFNKLTFFETIERVAELGLRYVEAYPNQRLSKETGALLFDHNLPADMIPKVKATLAEAKVRLVNYGIVPLPNDETACRKVFDFAHAMDIETLTSEPPDDALDLVDRLAREYRVNVAMHNHPKPSENWDPAKVLAEVQGRSKYLGACADISHWQRSGVEVVDALKRLEGRIVCFHLGEVDREARDAYLEHGDDPKDPISGAMAKRIQGIPNVVFGAKSGAGEMHAWLAEIRRQGIQGVFSIEAFYAEPPDQAMDSMRKSIAHFETLAAEIAKH